MRASDVAVSAGTRKRLGPALGEVCGWLWAKDCQTCGQPLTGQPALCIDDFGAFATASLHHPRCRRAGWNDSGHVNASRSAGVSWTCRAWASLPFTYETGEQAPRPFFMVNPGLELVFLAPSDDGWHPELPKAFPAAGLRPPGGDVEFGRPVRGLSASLASRSVKVRQTGPPGEAYATQVDDDFTRRAREAGGLMFGVTHLVNPAEPVTGDQLHGLMLTGAVLIGWVALRP